MISRPLEGTLIAKILVVKASEAWHLSTVLTDLSGDELYF
jgi:hypothetical protein